ncbi:hypothetical protein GIB67_005682 [Kingdonia uniflora]|uniref:Uncharacterized protein n=1 Tax=Kingdonia uniflora TaxID=39325 RepID=A0A7J7NI03_9MAGN|nr:hypothetical protein GIB67_005682 [Kingdonia uniflora]
MEDFLFANVFQCVESMCLGFAASNSSCDLHESIFALNLDLYELHNFPKDWRQYFLLCSSRTNFCLIISHIRSSFFLSKPPQ